MALSLSHTLQALLFASGEALSRKRVLSLLEIPEEMLEAAVAELQEELRRTGLALITTNDEFELRTSPDASLIVEKFRQSELSRDLGKAGLETLAIVLYQNGATRGEVDFVRGVNSTAALRSLLLRGLVERSTDDADKRRARYTATIDALAHLGLTKREDLPGFSELSGTLGAHHVAAQEETSAEVA